MVFHAKTRIYELAITLVMDHRLFLQGQAHIVQLVI